MNAPNTSTLIYYNGFLVDTGAKITIVPKTYPATKISSAKDTFQLKAANGTRINTYGMAEINIQIGVDKYIFNAVVGDVTTPILGMDLFKV